jgi:hypothetical protein
MRVVAVVPYICCLLALHAPCKRSNQVVGDATSAKPDAKISARSLEPGRNYETGPAQFDVCSLLQPQEIQTITGSSIEQNKSSERSDGSFHISQCVYVARQADHSISLVATRTDPAARQKRSPKDFWRERFSRYREQEEEEGKNISRESETGGRESEEGRPPRKIEGLGEEAFWTAGSLYVLQKDAFLRLSIGGSDSEETKLEHAKALAVLALKRLSSEKREMTPL